MRPQPPTDGDRVHYLLIANQTLGGERLRTTLQELAGPDTSVHLVVPATLATDMLETEFGALDEVTAAQIGRRRAEERLSAGLMMLAEFDIDASGEIGHPDPMEALTDAMASGHYDEVILSTLPVGISRWIKMDLPSRVARKFDIPVIHVEASS